MCNIYNFFQILLCYFVFLTSFTLLRKEVTYKGVFFMFTSFLSIFAAYLVLAFNDIVLKSAISEFTWAFNSINWLGLEVSIALRLDMLSYLFVVLVLVIGLGTNFYVLNYLKYEAHEDIFALLINWFMLSMILLVLANNLFTLFLGWESIGLSSFFLINFWSTRRGTLKSSFKAFFFNKISDIFLFLFIVLVHYLTYTNNLTLLNIKTNLNVLPTNTMYVIASICLFSCTLFKSAQLFGHLWLPDSMEAPVPASALIHSATLVSAGVYLLLRLTPVINLTNLHIWALVVGSITAAYGGVVSASQTDMKKLLAYSTISHCGFLFVLVGTQVYVATIIYLFLHGLFKALTFFCAGSFIRVSGSQDTRMMGGLSRILPVDTILLIICAFNLGGLPFSLGYLYKGILITSILNYNYTYLVLGFITIGLLTSLIYVYRIINYSAFDVVKEPLNPLIYELQQKQIKIIDYWSSTTLIQILAVSILILFTGWIYLYFSSYFLYSDLIVDHLTIALNSNSKLFCSSNTFFKSYYELFYMLYLLVFYALNLITWRVEYTFMFKLNFFVSTNLFFIFFVSYSTLL